MKHFAIAIDGPTGAGKSTIAREISRRLGCTYIDTGAMYRAIGLYVLRKGIASDDAGQIVPLLSEIVLTITHAADGQHIFLNGEDVSAAIRTPDASIYASNVSKIPEVRAFLLQTQRDLAKHGSVIMDGRDIGTVILPDADVKIFLTASPESRAQRRYEELIARGQNADYPSVLNDLLWRDQNDSTRSAAPLKPADDAILLDTTGFSFERSTGELERLIRARLGLPESQIEAAQTEGAK